MFDTYFSGFDTEISDRLQKIYTMIKQEFPDAEEKFRYGIPTFWKKKNLIHFAGYANHIGIYPGPKAIAHFKEALQGIPHSKGAIQCKHDQELPIELLLKILHFIKENSQNSSS